MPNTLNNSVNTQRVKSSCVSGSRLNPAECELLRFINSVSELFGPDQSKFLTGIWMDALVSMECMPGPASQDWGLVTLAASMRLAAKVLEIPNRHVLI